MSLPRHLQQAEDEANALIEGNTNKAPEPQAQENTPPEQPKEIPQPAASDDGIDWKAKYEVLQGKYNKEVPTLIDKVKALESSALQPNETDSNLKHEVETLRQQLGDAQRQLQESTKSEPTLNQHLVDEYGEEFAKAVADAAAIQVEAVRDEFNQKYNRTQENISTWTTESKMSAIKQSLSARNIDFNQVDNDPLFHEWLSSADQYSGLSRHSLLMDAFNGGDINRVVLFYSDFVDSQKARSEQSPFANHVETPPNPVHDSGTQNPVFDPDAFADLHRRYQRGLISDAEFVQKERELYAALQR